MNYENAMEFISSIQQYGMVPGLESIRHLCERLQNPQDKLKFVHIAGTNGKGSTLAYVSTVVKTAGYKVGRYISPAITCYEERFQINGKKITKKDLCLEMELLKEVCGEMVKDGLPHPTPFEIETALAFDYFAKKECDLVILETGMGGRLDATNVVKNTLVAVITSISMDHMNFLGDTTEKIALEKAGIIKEGSRVVVLKQGEKVLEVVKQKALEQKAPLIIADPGKATGIAYGLTKQKFNYENRKNLVIPLAGIVQISNAVLAIEVIKALRECGLCIGEEALREGLRNTEWLGRFSVIGTKPYFVIDGAHNEDAAKKLAQSIEMYFTNKRIIYIMGILRDKEHEKIVALTAKYAQQVITVATPNNPRAMDSIALAQEVMKYNKSVTAASSVEEAVEMAYLLAGKEDVILAFGSLSFLGRILEKVQKKNK